ncbi:DNA repair protein RecN [Apilactobacillus micheneri]|uniref:DNA repair protein RecN n=1 Tax=Apilactobacillus micheneri TaxID=1899430 RepID=UPI001127672A|nr:DNA repair protein RecN [Apilactobacillus micheneri]TPR44694.1 DNA repair protein RecN [Apilactobacillus micheneri]TPR48250.1 DNA repair protein RecN [Apilactobacillus micheneri]TPR51813.1 DNA repair protein RecN [Apilactobacillus micheneri]
MLENLSISNLAIIDKLEIDFSSGMTVLTGETGAGKSIIIDAVGLLAGNRGSQKFIRNGSNKLLIQGLFVFPQDGLTYKILDGLGIDHSDGSVILQREIYRNGKNICRVNGILVNTTTLKRIGSTVVDIQGQNDSQDLMQPDKHVKLLDEFGSDELQPLLKKYNHYYEKYNRLSKLIEEKRNNEKEWSQRLDMLQFQENEIGNANLENGEEERLSKERDHLQNYQKIVDSLNLSFSAINGDDAISPLDMIGQAMNAMQSIEDVDSKFGEISDNIKDAFYLLQDASDNISDQVDLQEFDYNRLEEIEERLNIIYELKRKYGDSIEQILQHYDNVKNELSSMQSDKETGEDLTEQYKHTYDKLETVAQKISSVRHKVSVGLENAIHQQLSDLYMSKTEFKVVFNKLPNKSFNQFGNEHVEFYMRTNPGESLLPLSKIASGGEISRILLALKTVFASSQGITSIVFDEVDTGVSGRVAQAIADKISSISRQSQVLCITHLPQVAAMADHHYFIKKEVSNDRTNTNLVKLGSDARVEELARMLSGSTVTKLTMEHANELLNLADDEKK